MKTAEEILKENYPELYEDRLIFPTSFKMYVNAMETFANQSKWISVEDRLPEKDIPILCLQSEGFEHKIWEQIILIYDGNLFVDIDENTCEVAEGYYLNITHWQPLPEKP